MSTDDEKNKISKLLQDLEVPDIKLTERCTELIKDFHEKFDNEIEKEEEKLDMTDLLPENPYKPPKEELDEIARKLHKLITQNNRSSKLPSESGSAFTAPLADPKRPWRTHSNRERLLRINNELKHHHEKGSQSVAPLEEDIMKSLIQEGEEENRGSPAVAADRLRSVVDSAKRNLPNFQYKKVDNTTATSILPNAHQAEKDTINVENPQQLAMTTA